MKAATSEAYPTAEEAETPFRLNPLVCPGKVSAKKQPKPSNWLPNRSLQFKVSAKATANGDKENTPVQLKKRLF